MSPLNVVVLLIGILGIGIGIYSIVVNKMDRRKKRTHAETEIARESEQRKRRDWQDNLGSRIYNAMRKTAAQSKNSIQVEKIPDNGKSGYTVIVGWKDDSCTTHGGRTFMGYHIISISVNLEKVGKEVHTFEGPYGPDFYYSLSDNSIEALLKKWTEMVENYSPYAHQ